MRAREFPAVELEIIVRECRGYGIAASLYDGSRLVGFVAGDAILPP